MCTILINPFGFDAIFLFKISKSFFLALDKIKFPKLEILTVITFFYEKVGAKNLDNEIVILDK